jgi:peptide/nickel transport system substrate-binding protein
MNSRKLFSGFACAAMALSLAACGSSSDSSSTSSSSSSSSSDNTLIVGTTQELAGVFSPLYYQTAYDGWVVNLVYNSLLQYDADSELQPDLAAELPEVDEDAKTVTFKLKEGVKFSDGSDFTADDVKFTFTLISDPSYDGRFSNSAVLIEGYDDYRNGDAEELTGVEVVDDYTVVFHLNTERIDAVSTLGGLGIVSDSQYEYTKGDLGGYKDNTSEPIGTNAYVLNSYDKSTGASFVKNENYNVDDDAYAIERVVIKTIATATELTSLETGEINYFPESIEANIIGPASLDENLTFNHYFRAAEGYFGFNCSYGATADEAVRQALAYATNRKEFGDAYFAFPEASEELSEVSLGYVPTVYWNPVSATLGDYVTGDATLDGLETYEYDLDKAKEILDDAGWVDEDGDGIREKDGQKLEVKFLASEGNSVLEMLIPIISKSWKEIGVDLQQTTVDFNTLITTVDPTMDDGSEWNVFFMAMSYTGVANTDLNGSLSTGEADNYSKISNDELDKLLADGMNTYDEAVSVENYEKAMILEGELVPYFPIYGNELFNVYATNIHDMNTGPVCGWSQALGTAYIE